MAEETEAKEAQEEPQSVQFSDVDQKANARSASAGNISLLLDVPLKMNVTLGKTKMLIKDLLQLGQGSIVELDKIAGDPMDIFLGEKLIARGEIVVVNEMFGVRITDIVSTTERIETLK